MASELRVDTLKDSSGNNSVGMAYVAGGSAKGWANLNGTGTIALRDSLNVASTTDNGTGDYTFTLSNSMSDANFAPLNGGNVNVTGAGRMTTIAPASSSTIRQYTADGASSAQDWEYVLMGSNGDLA